MRIHFCEDLNHSNQGYIRTGESEPQFMTEDWPLKNMRNILAFFMLTALSQLIGCKNVKFYYEMINMTNKTQSLKM